MVFRFSVRRILFTASLLCLGGSAVAQGTQYPEVQLQVVSTDDTCTTWQLLDDTATPLKLQALGGVTELSCVTVASVSPDQRFLIFGNDILYVYDLPNHTYAAVENLPEDAERMSQVVWEAEKNTFAFAVLNRKKYAQHCKLLVYSHTGGANFRMQVIDAPVNYDCEEGCQFAAEDLWFVSPREINYRQGPQIPEKEGKVGFAFVQ